MAVGEASPTRLVVTVAVSTHEGTLHVCQESGRRRCTLIVTSRCTIVADVAGLVRERSVEAYRQGLRQRDVSIEADVQAVHVIVLQRALCCRVTHRQVVVGHSVTTLDVDTVVLSHGCMVDKVLPVRILVVLVVVVIVLVFLQELERADGCVGGLQQLRCIAAVLVGIHNRDVLRLEPHASRYVGWNAGGH